MGKNDKKPPYKKNLLIVFNTLERLFNGLCDTSLLIKSDNMSTAACINKGTATHLIFTILLRESFNGLQPEGSA